MEEVAGKPKLFTRKMLISLIIPLIVEQLLAITIGIADTMMVSSAGEAAVSGISLVDSVNILLIQIFSALATGGAVVAAQYIGRKSPEQACESARQLFYAITALSLVIMTFSLIFCRQILHLIFGDIEADVMKNAETYFLLSALSYPFLAIYNAGAALFRAMGNSKVSMMSSLLMNIINIGGNAILIFGFKWGVAGAATASLVSRAVAAVIMLVLIKNKRNSIHVASFKPVLKWGMIRNILKIGIPNGVENGMFQVGKLLVQSLIATFGTAAIAANAIANSIAAFANVPGMAIGLAVVTVVGQCVGAGEYGQAEFYTKKLFFITYAMLATVCVVMFFIAPPLIPLFHLSAQAEQEAVQLLRVFCVAMVIWPFAFLLPNTLRAAGDAGFTMIISVVSMCAFRVGFSYLLALTFNMGLMGIWVAMYIDWFVRGVLFTIRLKSGRWKRFKVV